MMNLPPEYDKCLHKHTKYLDKHMVPDGVFVYLSGAKITDDEDNHKYHSAPGTYDKNHTLLNIVAKHGRKGFEAFLEALKTTGQGELAAELEATLQEQYSNAIGKPQIGKIKNDAKQVNSTYGDGPSTSYAPPTPQYIVYSTPTPRPGVSFSPSRSRSVARTPLTPPLTEGELVDHIHRLKSLLARISSSHADFHSRQEAQHLLGELDEAGQSMLDRVHQLSEENEVKDQELRRAKYMVRGLEAEIQELKTKTVTVTPNKSKTCVVL